MTMTVARLKDTPAGTVLAVVPTDAWPHGNWSGEARRTLTGWAARDAVAARLLGVEKREHPEGGARSVAVLEYETGGVDAFLPGAVLGAWADLRERVQAARSYPDLAARAAHVARALGAGVNAGDREGQIPTLFLSVDAAERIAVFCRVARDELDAGRPDHARAALDEVLDPEGGVL